MQGAPVTPATHLVGTEMGTGPHCSWRRRARAFPEPSTAAQAGASPTSARAIGSGPPHMVCGRASRCCQLSLTVSTRRWKHYQEKLIPKRLIPETHPTSPRGGRNIWGAGRAEAEGCPGVSWLSYAACTRVPQLPEPCYPFPSAGTGQGTPSSQGHSSQMSPSPPGPAP